VAVVPEDRVEQRQDTPERSGPQRLREALRASWQVWLLLIAAVLLAGGIVTAVVRAPGPQLGGPLTDAEALIVNDRHADAVTLLNREVYPHLSDEKVSAAAHARYHLLLARALHGAQKSLGADVEQNNRNIAAAYLEAERYGAALEPGDVYALAETYLRLDSPDEALRRADGLAEHQSDLRRRVIRRVVERSLEREPPDHDRAVQLVSRLLAEPDLPMEEQLWCLARQAEVRMAQGRAEEAVTRLVQSIVRLRDRVPDSPELGELYYLLGVGHFRLGELDEAVTQFERASSMLSGLDVRRGRAELLTAEAEAKRGDTAAARDRYATLASEWELTPLLAPALLGLAETRCTLGEEEAALETYERLVEAVRRAPDGEPDRTRVTQSLLARYGERYFSGDTPGAMRYAQLAESLYTIDEATADVLLALAEAHRRAADEIDAAAGASADLTARRQAQHHLLKAGEYYAEHMNRVVLTDNDAYARSLWLAADSFDRGGDRDRAILRFRDYASGFPDDPRQAEARFRLARCFQAMGQIAAAAEEFRSLITDKKEAKGVGPWADASYVPLAQTLLGDADPDNDAEAEDLLVAVVHGELGDSESAAYRDALIELGSYLYGARRFRDAVERLEEAARRFPDDPATNAVRYRLADSYRLLAGEIAEETAREAMPSVRARELARLREDYLFRALSLFEEARAGLEAVEPGRRTIVDEVQLRNAYLYLGDCAMELGEHGSAIRHYTAARDRYPRDPASLVALVQIVNAHLAMGEVELARTSNERARRFFESLPDEAWDDPYLPMSRQDWERWLNSTLELDRLATDRRSSAGP